MSESATPKKKRPTYSRPTKYPAAIPRTMTTEAQRGAIDVVREERRATLGEAVRALVEDGLTLDAVFTKEPELRGEISRLAREADVSEADAIATLLSFAVRESRRRVERNARLAYETAQHFHAGGFELDGVNVGTLDLHPRDE